MSAASGTVAESGVLYVVATPIGNLADLSARAAGILGSVDLIAAEDTRRSGRLLQHLALQTPMIALHEHNEREQAPRLVEQLRVGQSLAMISDAGTPLISDPGFNLVRLARQAGIRVVPVPGPSALLCALSAAGLPTDRFVFEGFLPARASARRARLEQLADEPRTLVFYESSHRIVDCLADMVELFGGERPAVLARELTKQFETFIDAPLEELLQRVRSDADQRKGEMVLLLHGCPAAAAHEVSAEAGRVLETLLEELPAGKAARLAARITGVNKRALYERALSLKGS
ncbi:MAG TPA: 16S rRNA (cytidine(1402)-2'-O)-methyltransferase [Gammaproteobacteria bacterium]|nr:16S rRNA (cytidine(1402)-2'-O)-methyltransferase [Gammaproteobacteria bacterium]